LQIFEQARWDLITRNGYGLREIHEHKVGPTILEVQMRFLRELKNRQRVIIKSWVDSYSGKVNKFAQQIWDESSSLCCDAMFTTGLFDLQARKLIVPTPEWLVALGVNPDEFARTAEQ
jgi:acyl-CoA thioester hydrolase